MLDDKRTLRQELTKLGFDWNSGRIIIWCLKGPVGYWDDNIPQVREIEDWADSDLDYVYDIGLGDPKTPHIIAEDNKWIYMPAEYDGASWLYKVNKNLDHYMINVPPYEGDY